MISSNEHHRIVFSLCIFKWSSINSWTMKVRSRNSEKKNDQTAKNAGCVINNISQVALRSSSSKRSTLHRMNKRRTKLYSSAELFSHPTARRSRQKKNGSTKSIVVHGCMGRTAHTGTATNVARTLRNWRLVLQLLQSNNQTRSWDINMSHCAIVRDQSQHTSAATERTNERTLNESLLQERTPVPRQKEGFNKIDEKKRTNEPGHCNQFDPIDRVSEYTPLSNHFYCCCCCTRQSIAAATHKLDLTDKI